LRPSAPLASANAAHKIDVEKATIVVIALETATERSDCARDNLHSEPRRSVSGTILLGASRGGLPKAAKDLL
jgi:hypothetical protein